MYLVGLHIYYKMIHGPYSIKLMYVDCRYFELNALRSLISIRYLGYSGQNDKLTCLVTWKCILNRTYIFITYRNNF